MNNLISLMICLPFAVVLYSVSRHFFTGQRSKFDDFLVVAGSGLSGVFGLALVTYLHFQSLNELSVTTTWIPAYSIFYSVSVDGLNAPVVLLISLVFPVILASEWKADRMRLGFQSLTLLLQTALLGAVCSQDSFLQFFFWSLSILPVYFLVSLFGDSERKEAAFGFSVSSFASSAILFLALLIGYFGHDAKSFLLADLALDQGMDKAINLLGQEVRSSYLVIFLITLSFLLRAPVWPLNGWFTRAVNHSSSAVMILISAVLAPVTVFLYFKNIYWLFKSDLPHFAPWLVGIGALALLAGSLMLLAQKEFRGLVAALLTAEMGFLMVGFGAATESSVLGAVLQTFCVGVGICGLGLIQQKIDSSSVAVSSIDHSGEPDSVGWVPVILGMVLLSLNGAPGFGSFVGKTLMVMGSFKGFSWIAVLLGLAFLVSIYFSLKLFQKSVKVTASNQSQLTMGERLYMLPLVLALLVVGIFPRPLIQLIRPAIVALSSGSK